MSCFKCLYFWHERFQIWRLCIYICMDYQMMMIYMTCYAQVWMNVLWELKRVDFSSCWMLTTSVFVAPPNRSRRKRTTVVASASAQGSCTTVPRLGRHPSPTRARFVARCTIGVRWVPAVHPRRAALTPDVQSALRKYSVHARCAARIPDVRRTHLAGAKLQSP